MKFSSIVGQANPKKLLLSMAQRRCVPHAMMFSGPEGNGALALAIAFSQYLLCENPGEMDSCGSCSHCKKVATLQHPDIHFSYPFFNKSGPEKTTSVDY
ncbi:MAG: DNA polymerase III subunit delta', partial [Flavobacteriales bacterium]